MRDPAKLDRLMGRASLGRLLAAFACAAALAACHAIFPFASTSSEPGREGGGPADGAPPDGLAADAAPRTPEPSWARRLGDGATTPQGVAADAAGNVYLAGYFSGTVDIDGMKASAQGQYDAFLVALDATGGVRWLKRFGAAGWDWALDLQLDGAGNVYIAGYYRGTVDFGCAQPLTGSEQDAFVASFSADGACRAATRITSTGYDIAQGLSVSTDGVAHVTGMTRGVANAAGQLQRAELLLARVERDGRLGWQQSAASTAVPWGTSVAATADQIVAVGSFVGGLQLGGMQLNAAAMDGFVAAFAADGSHGWHDQLGGPVIDRAHGVAADLAGNVYVSGTVGVTDEQQVAGGSVFLASYGPGGAPRWKKQFPSPPGAIGRRVSLDSQGNVYLAGGVRGPVSFGGETLAGENLDPFAASFTADGAHRWSQRFSGTGADETGIAIAVSGDGAVFVTGIADGALSFGAVTVPATATATGFIAKLE